jgi:hypothetical protein
LRGSSRKILFKEHDMKKLMKILGIMTAALLVGGMIIGCTHADLGYDTSIRPDHTAPALVAGGNGGGGGGGGNEDTSVPAEFKAAILEAHGEIGDNMFGLMLSVYGLGSLPSNPNTWTNAQWAQAWNTLKDIDFEDEGESGDY